jgi:hypothetical protein
MPLALLALVLAAAPADLDRCRQALAKVSSHEAPERIDAFQACGNLLGDQTLRSAWFGVVHTSPFDAAPILAMAAREPVTGASPAPNACLRSKTDLPICTASRAEAHSLRGVEKAAQWRKLFMRLLDADLPAAQATLMQKAFGEKWPLLFPEPPPPGLPTDGPLRVSGNIDRLAVLKGIAAVRAELDKCLPSPQAEVTLKWMVTAQGQVTSFAVIFPGEPERVACLTRAFKPAVMPVPSGGGVAIIVWSPEFD